MTEKRTDFTMIDNAFKFKNTFENHEYSGGIHLTTNGRCGGMSYAANDYFTFGRSRPANTKRPSDGTNLARYIYNRQVTSILNTIPKWAERIVQPWRSDDFFASGYQMSGQLGLVKESIDQGDPVTLCLMPTNWDLSNNPGHQVLAIGYSIPPPPSMDVFIYIYNPNYKNSERVLYPDRNRKRFYEINKEDIPIRHEPLTNRKVWLWYFADTVYLPLDPSCCESGSPLTLSGRDLSGQNWGGLDLVGAQCIRTNFSDANLHRSDLTKANLSESILVNANLTNTTLTGSTMNQANLMNADLRSATLDGANADDGCTLVGANLDNASLEEAYLRSSNMRGIVLSHASLTSADLQGTNLDKADLQGSSFFNADLRNCTLTNSNLSNTKFHNTDLRGADFSNADLNGANFQGAQLSADCKLWSNVRNGMNAVNLPPTIIPCLV